jgi:Protein of unknown function with HXXEE motif
VLSDPGSRGVADEGRSLDALTRWLVLALPVAFLAHDVGEVRGNAELNDVLADLSFGNPLLARAATSMRTSDRQMTLAVSALTLGCAAVSTRAVRRPAPSSATSDFAAATVVVGGHILGHVAQSLLLRRRAPGLAGGLMVTLPYAVLVVHRLHSRQYVEGTTVIRRAAVGMVALGPTLAMVRLLARRLG